jgi:hypothetical protein
MAETAADIYTTVSQDLWSRLFCNVIHKMSDDPHKVNFFIIATFTTSWQEKLLRSDCTNFIYFYKINFTQVVLLLIFIPDLKGTVSQDVGWGEHMEP